MNSQTTSTTRITKKLHFRTRLIFISFDCDSDLSAGVTGFEIRIRGGGFSKRIGFGESGHDLSALRQIAQNAEILFVNVDAKHNKFLLRKFRMKSGGEGARQIEECLFSHSLAAYAGPDTNTAGLEDAATPRKRMI